LGRPLVDPLRIQPRRAGFLVPSTEDGFEKTFLIEASIDGVDITDLRHYARDLSLIYDIAIKRCEQPWMTVDVQRSIRGHMLNYIKANYDYWTVLGFIRRLTARRNGNDRNSPEGQRKALWRRRPPTSFVCSGFVQYGFLAAISRLIQTHEIPREAMEQVLFKPGLRPDAPPEEILGTSPEDLATTDASPGNTRSAAARFTRWARMSRSETSSGARRNPESQEPGPPAKAAH
jgi:hypothetical protein